MSMDTLTESKRGVPHAPYRKFVCEHAGHRRL